MNTNKQAEAKTALLEINKLLVQLDPSIRAPAFDILLPLFFGEEQGSSTNPAATKKTERSRREDNEPTALSDFIASHDHKKPADNVTLLAAWLYSMYGVYPITVKELKTLGASCGLILPTRPDNTMRQAKNKGKTLFNQQGKGWQPTVSGEIFFKEEYEVKKGNEPLPKE